MTAAQEKRVGDFVSKYWRFAKLVQKTYGINPVIVLAQAALETGWGTSNLALNHNNFFGLTVGGANAKTPHWGGKVHVSRTNLKIRFRSYDSVEAGFLDFGYFIQKFRSYAEVRKHVGNIEKYAEAVARSRYISESNGDDRALYQRTLVRNFNDMLAWAEKKSPDPAALVAMEVLQVGDG